MNSASQSNKKRIVILGGGFGGAYTARRLEKICKGRQDVEVVLVSRDNFLLMTPLLFEVCSGTLDIRDCAFPIRAFLRRTRFAEATVQGVDLERRVVHVTGGSETGELAYDQLVLALGAMTNQEMIPGSEHAFTFKTLADALFLRNRLIECFERASVEAEPTRRRQLLTFVIIGGGLVGVELFGEVTAFVDEIAPLYQRINRNEVRFILLQGGPRIMPEMNPTLADYGMRVLSQRRGVDIRTQARVRAIEPGKVHLADETVEAGTVILAAGVVPNPVVAGLPVPKDNHGHILVDATMRCPTHPEVWAIGDLRFDPRARRQTLSQSGPACVARSQGPGWQSGCRVERRATAAIRLRQPRNDGFAGSRQGLRPTPQSTRSWRSGLDRAAHLLLAADARLEQAAAYHGQLDLCAPVSARHRQTQPGQRGGHAAAEFRGRQGSSGEQAAGQRGGQAVCLSPS